MKKILLITTVVTASISVFAQDSETAKQEKEERWDGRTFTPFVSLGAIPSSSTNIGLMSAVGCQVGYMLNSHLGLYTAISFAEYNWTESYNLRDGAEQCKNKTNYIQIPLTLRVVTSKVNRLGLFAEAGLNFGVLSSAEQKITYFGTRAVSKSRDIHIYSNAIFSAYFFYGVKIPLSNKARLLTGLDHYVFLQDQLINRKSQLATAGLRIGVEVRM